MTSPALSQPGLWQQQAPDSSTTNYNRYRQYHGLPEHYSRAEPTEVDCRPSVMPISQGLSGNCSRAEQTAVDCRPSVTPINQGHTGEVRYFISDSVDPEHPVSFTDSLLSTSLSTDPVYVPACTINSSQEGNYGCNLVSSSNDVTAQFLQSSGYSIEQSEQGAGVVDKQQRSVAGDGSSSGTEHLLSLDEHDLEQNPTLNLAINNPEIWNVFDTFDSPEKEAEEVQAKTGNRKAASKQLYANNSQTVAKADLSAKMPGPRSLANGERKYVKRDKKSGFTVTRELAMQHLKRCSCPANLERDEVPAEQVFVREGQMYRLPEANVIRLGNKEFYAFIKENECFLSLALFFKVVGFKVQKLYERVIMEKLVRIQLQEMGDNEMELLRQKCQLSVLTKQKDLINLADLISLSKIVLERDPTVKIAEILASAQVEQKVLETSSLRCSVCGLPCRKETERANYIPLEVTEEEEEVQPRQPEVEDTAEGEVCLTEYAVGVLVVKDDKLTAFKTEDKTYLSIKEVVKRKLMPLQRLQQKMSMLGFKPVTLPEEMEGHHRLNGIIMNTLWVDTVQLRCCICLGSKKFVSINRSMAHRICSGDYSFTPIFSVYCRKIATAKGDVFIHDKSLEVVREDLDRYPVDHHMKSFQIAKDVPVRINCVYEEFSVRRQGGSPHAGQNLAGNCVASSPDTTTDMNLVCTAYNAAELKSACKNLEDLDPVHHEGVASSELTHSGQLTCVVMPSSSTLVTDQSTEVLRVSNSYASQPVPDRTCNKENHRMLATVSIASEPETYIITDEQLSQEDLNAHYICDGGNISTVVLPSGTCTPSSQAVEVSKGPTLGTTLAPAKEVINVNTEETTNLPIMAQSLARECVVIDKDKLGKQREKGEMVLNGSALNGDGSASQDDHHPTQTVSLSVNPQLTVDHPQSVEDSQTVNLYVSENVSKVSEIVEDVSKRSSDTKQETVREIEPIAIDDSDTIDKQQEYSCDKTLPSTDREIVQKPAIGKHSVTDKQVTQVETEVKKQTVKLKPGKYIVPNYGPRCKQIYQTVSNDKHITVTDKPVSQVVTEVKKQTVKLKPGTYIMPDYGPWCNFVLDKSEPIDDGSVSVTWSLEVKEKENSQMRIDSSCIEIGKRPGGDVGLSEEPVGLIIDLNEDGQMTGNVGSENADMETEDQAENVGKNEISVGKKADIGEACEKAEGQSNQHEVSDESMSDPCLEQEVGDESMPDPCLEQEVGDESMSDPCLEQEVGDERMPDPCLEQEVSDESMPDPCLEQEVGDESMSDPCLEQEVESTHTVITKETHQSNVTGDRSNKVPVCLSPGSENNAAVEHEPRETNVEPEKTDISRHDMSDVSSPTHGLQTSTVSYGCSYSPISLKEGAHTNDTARQEKVDQNTSHDITNIDVECASEENSIIRPAFRSPQPFTECSESPSSPSLPTTSTPITARKSCSVSRVDRWYTKIAPLNNSTSLDVSLQMLATIATAETDPDSATESDKEEQDSSHGNTSVFGKAKHRPTKHQANTLVESGSFHFSLTDEKRQALEEEREALEANMKKYLVFSVSKGTPPKFSVQRFKPGAEKIFPVLFYPDPNHPSIVKKRQKFMEAAAKYLENKYFQHVRKHRPSSKDSKQKIPDTHLTGKPDAITTVTVTEPADKATLRSLNAKVKAQSSSTVTNATKVTVGEPAEKATLRTLNAKIKARTSCANAATVTGSDKEQSKVKYNVITQVSIGKAAERLRSLNAKGKTQSSRTVTNASTTETCHDKEQLKVKSPASTCIENAKGDKTLEKECSRELKSKRCLRTANSPGACIVNGASESVEQTDSPEHAEKAGIEAGGKGESVTCDQTNHPAKAYESYEFIRKRNRSAIAKEESRYANNNQTGQHKTDANGGRVVEIENLAKSVKTLTVGVKPKRLLVKKVQPASPRTKRMRVVLRIQVAEKRHENTEMEGEVVNRPSEVEEDKLISSRKKSNSGNPNRKPRKECAQYPNTELGDSSRDLETEKPDIAEAVNHFGEIEQYKHRKRSYSGKPDRKPKRKSEEDHKTELRLDSSPKRVTSRDQDIEMTEINKAESVSHLDIIEKDKHVRSKKLSNSGKGDRKPTKQSAQDQKAEFRDGSPRISKNQETEETELEEIKTVNPLGEIKEDKLVRKRKRSNSEKPDRRLRKKSSSDLKTDFRDSQKKVSSGDQEANKIKNGEAESVKKFQFSEKEQDKHVCRSRKSSNSGKSDRKPRKESVQDQKTELRESTPKLTSSRSVRDKVVVDKSPNEKTLEPKPQIKTDDSPEKNTSRSASDLVKENASKGDKLKAEVREDLSQARKETSESSNLNEAERSSNAKACAATDKDVKSPEIDNCSDKHGAHVRLKKLKFLDDAVCSYYKLGSNTIQNKSEADNKRGACGTDTEGAEAVAVGVKRKAPSSAKQNTRKIRKL